MRIYILQKFFIILLSFSASNSFAQSIIIEAQVLDYERGNLSNDYVVKNYVDTIKIVQNRIRFNIQPYDKNVILTINDMFTTLHLTDLDKVPSGTYLLSPLFFFPFDEGNYDGAMVLKPAKKFLGLTISKEKYFSDSKPMGYFSAGTFTIREYGYEVSCRNGIATISILDLIKE